MMQDLLHKANAWLADQLHEHLAVEVVYGRGIEDVSVRATIGRTLLKLDDGYGGVRMEWTDRDFLIRAADLVLDGAAVVPQRGDRITEGPLEFSVLAPAAEPVWRWSDPHRQVLRIHTKFTGRVE